MVFLVTSKLCLPQCFAQKLIFIVWHEQWMRLSMGMGSWLSTTFISDGLKLCHASKESCYIQPILCLPWQYFLTDLAQVQIYTWCLGGGPPPPPNMEKGNYVQYTYYTYTCIHTCTLKLLIKKLNILGSSGVVPHPNSLVVGSPSFCAHGWSAPNEGGWFVYKAFSFVFVFELFNDVWNGELPTYNKPLQHMHVIEFLDSLFRAGVSWGRRFIKRGARVSWHWVITTLRLGYVGHNTLFGNAVELPLEVSQTMSSETSIFV